LSAREIVTMHVAARLDRRAFHGSALSLPSRLMGDDRQALAGLMGAVAQVHLSRGAVCKLAASACRASARIRRTNAVTAT
jgi:hypothetical protein